MLTLEDKAGVLMESLGNKVKESDKFINRFILRAKGFVWYACFQYGHFNFKNSGEIDTRFAEDFSYFVFTKSTKSLISIRLLLHNNNMEDALILLRTVFEGYMASRFIVENDTPRLIRDFVFIPQFISKKEIIFNGETAKLRNGELIDYEQMKPSKMKLGKDKGYFYDFYEFLCNYAHCNFSIISCYLDERESFTVDKVVNAYVVRILVIFVYTKLFEQIVTVEGEDFLDERTEKECYLLVKEATLFLDMNLDFLGKCDYAQYDIALMEHMKKMFTSMRKSLREEVGSLHKDFLPNLENKKPLKT